MHIADSGRYDHMTYNHCGRSGLKLPAISLGLWRNFGSCDLYDNMVEIIKRSFDLGITHFDLANTYGPYFGAAEENLGRILKNVMGGYRNELVISTKAGHAMWPGPYGNGGSRKYMLTSLDESLKRLGLEYVDIFYSHCPDPETPLEETMGALATAVRQGKALYAGISKYSTERTREAANMLRDMGTPCLIHQPSYNMFDRHIEQENLFDALEDNGMGAIVFSPLAQGLLTDKYINGVPEDSRAARNTSLQKSAVNEAVICKIKELHEIANERGQKLAQMAVAWLLRDNKVTSVLVGASKASQIEDSVAALSDTHFSSDERTRIDAILSR